MSNELTISASLVYSDGTGSDPNLAVASLLQTIATKTFSSVKLNVTSAVAVVVPLAGVSSPGWAMFMNRDPTNYISLSNTNGGPEICRLPAGNGSALLYLGDTWNIPWAKANTANCALECLISSR